MAAERQPHSRRRVGDRRDATAGPDRFELTGTTTSLGDANDIVDFDVGTPDVTGLLRARRPGNPSETRAYSLAYTARGLAGKPAGFLRAERPGTASERLYRLTYTAEDVAGNTSDCEAEVALPHDRSKVALASAEARSTGD
jgi:hypothetical protein